VQHGAGWSTRGHREAQTHRRELGLQLLRDPKCGALGVFDVSRYYPAIELEQLGVQLGRIGAPSGTIDVLILSLRVLAELSGSTGLPIGFEGSGLLGNVYLLSADSVYERGRLGLLRYTDDTWLFLADRSEWEAARSEYAYCLSNLGLSLNETKTRVYDAFWDNAEAVITHGLLDSITEGNTRRVTPDEAVDLFQAAIDQPETDWRALRFALGTLRRHRDPRATALLEHNPWIFDREPKATADYLIELSHDAVGRRRLDHDWLIGHATRDSHGGTLAGQLHACRVASAVQLDKALGGRLLDLALSPEHQTQVPLQTWAAFAWGSSKHWRPGRAVDGAKHAGSLSVRRGLVLSCANRSLGRSGERHLRELIRIEPDLTPTIEYSTTTRN
jgi:hypothetical protein